MRMQEPEQWQSSETPGTTGQEYGTYRAETGQNALGQKIFPQESRVSVLNVLIIVFSAIGFCSAIVGIVFSVLVLYYNVFTDRNFLLVGFIVALLLFVAIFVLSIITAVITAVRRTARFR